MKNLFQKRKANHGFILVNLYLIIAVLLIEAGALATYAMAEVHGAQWSQASVQALYLAEAGVDQAIVQLRQNFSWLAGYSSVPVGSSGSFSVTVQSLPNSRKRLTSQGSSAQLATSVNRSIDVIVQKWIPPGFYDNAIWEAEHLDLRGNAYQIVGNIRYGDTTPPSNTGQVQGTLTYDPAANPLPRLSFQDLYNIALSQGNIYDSARLSGGSGVFPTSFWYQPPTDPNDPTTGIPNVNYVTTDLILNGNIGTIGGFFVVVGNVLTDPSATEDTTLDGNGQVQGAIYTTGDFRINGGGNGLNVDGGIWAGDEARVNGNATVNYDASYMQAIRALNVNADVQVVSWEDLSNR